ncbi:MAG: prepilin-type N-terminal cleavage/methylation domain-containing protein [Planctomycetes bacterium]|nr:prepilin-type N-terminal cleavage/methylation domain-containing protein [Planctomycetota bacterium]MCB9911963.1 prepilin-type N-terminal cleavage/methylation domain-containing protein [Planctomycetota bacterium]HPF13265.1 prepilin-type N-terminal cleavage/methylation domain-containing protein [Planctomycetota bacterium]HRV80472.1 prepilin-type N-terminal cleavage/methylation domain-containing protein [Planctomycetota bacterium]
MFPIDPNRNSTRQVLGTRIPGRRSASGFTLVEVIIASSILAILMASMMVGMQSESKHLGEQVTTTHRERAAQVLLHRMEQELTFAAGAATSAWLGSGVSGGSGTLTVDTSVGFPPSGTLLLEPGSASEERVDYTGLDRTSQRFEGLDHGVQCTDPRSHAAGTRVYWASTAAAIENQVAPAASAWDGRANGPFGPIFYRGDGTGFSFRVPTDPAGNHQYFAGNDIRWGAKIGSGPSANGWSCLQFVAQRQITEAQAAVDLNADGDLDDTFDLGQIRLRSWDAFQNGEAETTVSLCPPIVLQEVCNYGGDLDNDGFEDPLFLWDPADGSLHIELFVLTGMHNQRAQTSRLASTLYLRNGAL